MKSGQEVVMNPRRVLIVEDDVFVAGLLDQSLQANGFLTAVTHDSLQAKVALTDFEPDVALIDVELGDGPKGDQLMSYILKAHPETAILMMTQRASFAEGIKFPDSVAFLLKSKISHAEELVEAIEATIRGQGHLTRHSGEESDLSHLTRIQEEVLRMIALGYSNALISQARGITLSGAEQAVSSVLKALGISEADGHVPRVDAARMYISAKGVPKEH